MSSGNICKYEFLTGKGVLPKKGFLEKVATISRPEYLPLDSEFMDQIGTAEKECQRFNYESSEN